MIFTNLITSLALTLLSSPLILAESNATVGEATYDALCEDGFSSHTKFNCARNCPENCNNVAGICWENCPEGYEDHGATCHKPLHFTGSDK